MNTAYQAAQNHYADLVERTRGAILQSKPFAFWLEEMKQQGKYWEHANVPQTSVFESA